MSFQFQHLLKGTNSHLNLGVRGLTSSESLKPKSRLDEILDGSTLPLSIGKSDDLIGESRDERDQDHPRGHFIPKREVMGDDGKDQNAHHHDDEQEARATPWMEIAESFHMIDD